MSMDYFEAMQEQIEAEFWERLPNELHEQAVQSYLGTYGDAIDARVKGLAEMAKTLSDKEFYGPSIAVSSLVIELMIRYFCVRPMVQGAFVSEMWADCLAGWVVGTRPADQSKILVGILKLWDIDVAAIQLEIGKQLWTTIQSQVFKKRHGFVHNGDSVSKEDAEAGIACVESFRNVIVAKIASRLGFTLAKTACWALISKESDLVGFPANERHFVQKSPFPN